MTSMSDLPPDLVVEILTRIPITSLRAVRSTCKSWNALTKKCNLGKAAATRQQQFVGFMTMSSKVCSVKLDFQGTRKDESEFVDLSINQVALFNQVEISKVIHCDGLLLCVTKDNSRLMLWNPYLGQTRWIEPRRYFYRPDHYALGYDTNRNHKILRFFDDFRGGNEFEIYHVRSSSWRVLDHITPSKLHHRSVTLKGNTYFFAREKMIEVLVNVSELKHFLLCFDFTRESFGQRLHLPFHIHGKETVTLSGVREEQLAVLYQKESFDMYKLEIWVTDKIDPNAVTWSKFLMVDMRPLTGFQFNQEAVSFAIDEEKKVVLVFDQEVYNPTKTILIQTVYIIGEDGYFKSMKIGENPNVWMPGEFPNRPKFSPPLVSSSYLPSLVQIN
ncbi:unnamed protein product [Arabidopsis halleri]